MYIGSSVTRLGELMHFWKLFKRVATIILPKLPTFLGNLSEGVKIFHFSSESFLGNFYRHLVIFYWSHWYVDKSIIIIFFSLGVLLTGMVDVKAIHTRRELFLLLEFVFLSHFFLSSSSSNLSLIVSQKTPFTFYIKSRPLFVYFRSFHIPIQLTKIQFELCK